MTTWFMEPEGQPTYFSIGGWIEFCTAQSGQKGYVIGDFEVIFPLGISQPVDPDALFPMQLEANYEALVSTPEEVYLGVAYGYGKVDEGIDFNDFSWAVVYNDGIFLEVVLGELYAAGQGILLGLLDLDDVQSGVPIKLVPLNFYADLDQLDGHSGFWFWKNSDDFFDNKMPDYDICTGTFKLHEAGRGIEAEERSIGLMEGALGAYARCE